MPPRESASPLTKRSTRPTWIIAAVAIAAMVVVILGVRLAMKSLPHSGHIATNATYAGRAACVSCHEREAKLYSGSHHDLAMQPADSSTVLGDFSGVTYTHFGDVSRFHRRGGHYFVTTAGADGKSAEFQIAYTFGVFPLQQYLIAMPGGRYQAFSVAWDARPKAEGGQRWFHLYPKERVPAGDILHWTGPEQNWNYMCAECHSTNVKKGWNSADSSYTTTFSEIDVSCEACHGPASAHVKWARRAHGGEGSARSAAKMGLIAEMNEPHAQWIMDPQTGIAHRDRPRESQAEIEMCARCHARRTTLTESYVPGRPLMQTHKPALLDDRLYYADGQQHDEVYEYGSFVQSRMYANGVSCGDCHDPHSTQLAAPLDEMCAKCHSPARFATPEHHHHAADSKGASCVSCHMPATNYMVIHARRDHSFRVPRPDLTVKLGAPNACNSCHGDRSAAWAESAIEAWYPNGRWKTPHYGEAIYAGRRGQPGAELALVNLAGDASAPGIARATAVELLGEYLSPASGPALDRALTDGDGLVRAAGIDAAAALQPADRVRMVAPLLRDSLLAVRIEAASSLAGESSQLAADQRHAFDAAVAEYRRVQATDADRPESYANLGALDARLGDLPAARAEYEQGLRVGPWFTALWINLADLLREQNNDAEGERVLRRGLEVAVDKANLHHALGLNLARQKRNAEALIELKKAVDLAPGNTRYAYVYGVALLSSGMREQACAVFDAALAHRPADRDLLIALATTNRDIGKLDRAVGYARRLVDASPGDPSARQLLDQLEAAAKRGARR
jgi:tetratricopeptide (TPR) repeat protein